VSQIVASIFKIFISFIMIMLFVSIFFYGASWLQAIDFKTYVEDQINREGGLTTTAMSNINEYNKNNYNSKFKVVSESGSDKKPYGTVVKYHIEGEIGSYGFNVPLQLVYVSGSGVSLVR